MPAIDTADGDHERALPTIVRASVDGAVQLVALIDGLGSWGCGGEAAARLHAALARIEAIPPHIDAAHLINRMCVPFRAVPDDWWADGWEFSVVGLLVRDHTATIVASGAFAVVHVRADERRVLFRPETLGDRLVRQGKVTPEVGESAPGSAVIVSPFFAGEARHLTVCQLDARSGDRILAGGLHVTGMATWATTAAELRDAGVASGRIGRPTAIVRW